MEKLMEILAAKLAMGGYAAYVWPSFILTALVMSAMVIVSLRSLRRAQKTLLELQQAGYSPRNEA